MECNSEIVAKPLKKDFEPAHNSEYNKQRYWEDRFKEEESYEWLVSFSHCKTQLLQALFNCEDVSSISEDEVTRLKSLRILLIGCGNSSLGYDLWKEGFTNVDCMDYADSVIQRMNEKYESEPEYLRLKEQLRFTTMDMMNMTYESGIFDFVIDKATMDVILTDNKDPWNPSEEVRERSSKTLNNCIRVLKPKGTFISISFEQPHFRKKLLMSDEFKDQWSIKQKNIDHGLGYFMYILAKNN